ncbi:MAG TPA: hypothetical protein QF446_11690 [Planctomycetota bacterium]|mgnify:CR=1 FL=1|jgi:hypothetical protein|nr:hypothetical protein [Planctomycetaceae bacterium]HJM57976.1 hypothetical protein [Planctomycetota bacterium]
MKSNWMWNLAKGLEGVGLLVVGIGLMMSISLGMQDDGLSSMKFESWSLLAGGVMFFCGWLLERSMGAR